MSDIHQAAEEGNTNMVRDLIRQGADVNAKNDDGETPLHCAAWEGHQETAQVLLANGADVRARANDGETPLDMAADDAMRQILTTHQQP